MTSQLLFAGVRGLWKTCRRLSVLGWLLVPLSASPTIAISLISSTPLEVGQVTRFQASASDINQGTLDYRFALSSSADPPAFRDFDPRTDFAWSPLLEGVYQLTVTARNRSTGQTASASLPLTVQSRIGPDLSPVISTTANPLVLLYSAPPCQAVSMHVVFYSAAVGASDAQSTPDLPCEPGLSRNFLIAGLRANTQYLLRPVFNRSGLRDGRPIIIQGPPARFSTGTPGIVPPASQVLNSHTAPVSVTERFLLQSYLSLGGPAGSTSNPIATDLAGNLVWYYDAPADFIYMIRPLAGGTFFGLSNLAGDLSEFDLAGNIIRETNIGAINEQLPALGSSLSVLGFHHDAVRLPNGFTAVLGSVDRIAPEQGGADVLGDVILVLDKNWQVVWVWNIFDHLDIHRSAILNETCGSLQNGCTALTPPATMANDWTHANSLRYLADGNFLLSVRHQDWVLKINYANGRGDGSVIWRIGIGGDFQLTNPQIAPFPFFSHQHDVSLQDGLLYLFDNGNTRAAQTPAPQNSRGQAYLLDESDPQNLRAMLVLNSDLGSYSNRVGSAQRLTNGNFHFLLGAVGPGSASVEITPSPSPVGIADFVFTTPQNLAYRSFRVGSLYSGEDYPVPGQSIDQHGRSMY